MLDSSEPVVNASPHSILIAEDHADSREALRALLEASGYSVMVARNGREAVALALQEHPDLILMDMMMPEVDGLEATRTLRQRAEFHRVPILALTAMGGGRDAALDAGCNDFLTKPIDLPSFFRKVQVWLGGGPSGTG